MLATNKVASCKKTPKIQKKIGRQVIFGGMAVLIGIKSTSTKKVPLQCTRCSVSFKKVEH